MSDLGFDNMQSWHVYATLIILDKPEVHECDVDMTIDTPIGVDALTLKRTMQKLFQDVEVEKFYTFRKVV